MITGRLKFISASLFFLCLCLSLNLYGQNEYTLSSPNGSLIFRCKIQCNLPVYQVMYKGKPLIDYSALHLEYREGMDFSILSSKKPGVKEIDDTYALIVGKAKNIRNRCRETVIELKDRHGTGRILQWVVRAYNDAVAFRFQYPMQEKWDSYTLTDERCDFNITGNPIVHTLFLPNFTSSHEGVYTTIPLNDVKNDALMDMPTLFETSGGNFIAITEAALIDYAGMYLIKKNGVLTSQLSPLPGQIDVKVKAKIPHRSPWRVMMISDRVGALVESNILTNLNDSCKIQDVSWIRPGKTTFPWWNGNVVPDTLNAPGNNFVTNQYYIDFCAANHIEYHSVVEYGLHEWYTNDGVSFMPGKHVDVTKPVPGLDMKEICDYAKKKGVGVRVWVHWKALYPQLDTAFAVFERWGLSGMMVDFMDRDDQEMVNMQIEILQKAAAHHLHIQFHGAYKPTGLQRVYPNEYTREGTLNYENNKWSAKPLDADHDLNMPFTRGLAGSTDYHLGGFRAVPTAQFRAQYTRPLMIGTRCHMLAMYVVLENTLGMVCDYPDAYLGQPGFDFLQQVPTVWDETKVPAAKVGEYIAVARRKNDDWFMGILTNHAARTLRVSLNFLPPGTYKAEIYSDAPDTDQNPNHLVQERREYNPTDSIDVAIAAGGGQVIRFTKK